MDFFFNIRATYYSSLSVAGVNFLRPSVEKICRDELPRINAKPMLLFCAVYLRNKPFQYLLR